MMTRVKRVSRGGAGLAAMLLVATPFVATWEGTETKPYWDALGGVWTVCTGETRVEMREYTKAECAEMLQDGLADFGQHVARLSPGIEDSPYEWAAHTSLAFNIGVHAYSRSSIRTQFNRGNRVEACRRFSRYEFAGGKRVRGLTYRRNGEGERIGERELCLAGAIPAQVSP